MPSFKEQRCKEKAQRCLVPLARPYRPVPQPSSSPRCRSEGRGAQSERVRVGTQEKAGCPVEPFRPQGETRELCPCEPVPGPGVLSC